MQDHCIELLLLSPQKVVVDVRELTTFRYRLTLLCRVRLPQGPRLPYMRTIVTFIFALTQHLQENDRFFCDTLRTIVFSRHPENNRFFFSCNDRRFFAVGAHRRSLADRPGGPMVHQHLLAGLCCIFTSTCLLDLLHLHQHLLAGLFCT